MTHLRLLPVAAFSLLLSVSVLTAQPLLHDTVVGPLGARIDDYMRRASAFGLSGTLLVARNGEVIVHRAYGLADRNAAVALRTDMPMLIGSLGKQFTATAIVKLESEGRLSTSDTLGRFFPDAPADKRGITIHQLLTHTAGLPYLPSGNLFEETTRDEVMRDMLALPLDSKPGSAYAYSSPGYTLLAGIIERASGERFENYLRRALFIPAGMTNTGFERDTIHYRGPLAVHSYSSDNDEGAVPEFPYSEKFIGAGTVISTAGDLYRWEQALSGDRILSAAAREKLLTPYVTVQGPTRYAYGWNVVTTIRNTRLITHGGDIGGYNAEMRRYVDEGLVVIFASNGRVDGAGYREAIMNPISLMINGGSKFPEPPAVVVAEAGSLDPLAGRYELSPGSTLSARVEGGRLIVGADGRDAIEVLSGSAGDTSGGRGEIERRAAVTLDALSKGDAGKLEKNLHPSIPVADMLNGELEWWRRMQDSLGRVERIESLGSAILSPQSARTYHRILFQRGSVLGMIGWASGRIVDIARDLTVVMATPFQPTAENSIASFDIFTGRTIRASFTIGNSGQASALTVHTARGDVVARRVGGG